ncbi:ABC transporter substrate-binding protein [Streptosporangium sp. NPDC004631]
MKRTKRFSTAVALTTGVALGIAGCGGEAESPASGADTSAPAAGGTLYVLNVSSAPSLDPQRNTDAKVFGFASRTIWRSLTALAPGTGELVGDLATDTGKVSQDGKTWTFTLRDGPAWQDGKPVACEDVKYGISRTFATDQITGGSSYAIKYLDIPKDDKGKSVYVGPYKKTGQELFDKAVTCDGKTIVFHLKGPRFDFNQTLTTSAFQAYRADQDKGAKSTYTVFSSGPYMLKGDWKSDKGGTFVRNPSWKADSDPVRKAYPDEIVFEEGLAENTPSQRIIADAGNDKHAVTYTPASPAQAPQIVGDPRVKDRTAFIDGTGVDFLLPNYKSPVMSDAKVRQALAMSTDRGAYAQAYGGATMYPPTFDILYSGLIAHSDSSPFGNPLNGDLVEAKKVLESTGRSLPVPITVTYMKNSTSDKAFGALAQGWQKAGFEVKLNGISQNYYSAIAAPSMATQTDVVWTTWGTGWPSASTVLSPTFDSRTNLSPAGSGLDNGYFDNDAINQEMDATSLIVDFKEREAAWGTISQKIAKDGGYIALTQKRYMFPAGSGVKLTSYKGGGIVGQIDLAAASVR